MNCELDRVGSTIHLCRRTNKSLLVFLSFLQGDIYAKDQRYFFLIFSVGFSSSGPLAKQNQLIQHDFNTLCLVTKQNNLAQEVSMEYSSTAIVFSQLSLFPSTLQTENRAYLFKPWKQRTCQSTRFQCHKMYVPGV